VLSVDHDCDRSDVGDFDLEDNGTDQTSGIFMGHGPLPVLMAANISQIFGKKSITSPWSNDGGADRCYSVSMTFNGKFARKVWAVVAIIVMVSMLASMAMFGY
jgi:hypothetical protein